MDRKKQGTTTFLREFSAERKKRQSNLEDLETFGQMRWQSKVVASKRVAGQEGRVTRWDKDLGDLWW